MEKRVIFRDRQELQSKDLNNIQANAELSLRHLVSDAVVGGMRYVGGGVAAASATEISIAAARLYASGKVYEADSQTVNLFPHLPLTARKVVSVVVWGEEAETEVEPRDFLIDLTTGATQPQAVAMQTARVCNINMQPGAESVDPQPPVIQSSTLAIAHVYLTPTGIDRIDMVTTAKLPSLAAHDVRLNNIEAWRKSAQPRITSIASDLSALAKKTETKAPLHVVMQIANDIGRLKQLLNMPTGRTDYDADNFDTTDKTDAALTNGGCIVDDGILFPHAGQASAALALFNPYDSSVTRHGDMILPAYEHEERIQGGEGLHATLSLAQYQVQENVLRGKVTPVLRSVYGPNNNRFDEWYPAVTKPVPEGVFPEWAKPDNWQLFPQLKVLDYARVYYQDAVTKSFNGAIVAQTFLVSNSFWLTRINLGFDQIADNGPVTLAICGTHEDGTPNPNQCFGDVTLTPSELKAWPLETSFDLEPILLEAGNRYAIVAITNGNHYVRTSTGNAFTQGTLFFGTDGDYFTGDLTRDLYFVAFGARFVANRSVVSLQPISLAGGISDLLIGAKAVQPKGAKIVFQIQVGGVWRNLTDDEYHLATKPDIVPLRVVFLGTQQLQAALTLAADAIVGSRPADAMTHVSTLRNLLGPTNNIEVQVQTVGWNDAHHTLDCQIISGAGNVYDDVSHTQVTLKPGVVRHTFTFTPPGINGCRIKLSGGKSAAASPFVITERVDVEL